MTYAAFDSRTQTAITGATAATIDCLATYGKGLADDLLQAGDLSIDEHSIVYNNIDGWRRAIHDGTTPPAWQKESEPL